jgi:hypothetical protein
MNQLYIPKKLNVGYQLREGTYTGKLAYVIYWDDKGKLRKEKSWESWRHKVGDNKSGGRCIGGKWVSNEGTYGDEVNPDVFENVPVEGFVLNKNAGGVKQSWGWNTRVEKCRVYDPRGFEFEISIPNLLFILQECNTYKGKGLDGEFVYSWSGPELVLLPVNCQEYKNCLEYTNLQTKKFSLRDLKKGYTYLGKNEKQYVYMGRENYYDSHGHGKTYLPFKKSHIFYCLDSKRFTNSVNVASEVGEYNEFNTVVDKFKTTKHGQHIVGVELVNTDLTDGRYSSGVIPDAEDPNVYHMFDLRMRYSNGWGGET